MQLQNLLSTLIERFEFSLPEKEPKIIRGTCFLSSRSLISVYLMCSAANCMATQPMIEGEYEKGPQLPLVVRRAA